MRIEKEANGTPKPDFSLA